MDEKLITAITERIRAGQTKEQIQAEVTATGYSEEVTLSAYNEALAVAAVPTPALIGIEALFRESFAVALSTKGLLFKSIGVTILGIFLPIVLGYGVFTYIEGDDFQVLLIKGVLVVVLATVALVVMMGSFFAVMRGLLLRAAPASFMKYFTWGCLSVISFSLIVFYVNVITQAGYLLFYLPGLVLAIYTYFALFVATTGEAKGVATLSHSTALVHGNFFAVFGRIILGGLALFGLFVAAMLLVVLASVFHDVAAVALLAALFPLAAFAVYWQICFSVVLFESLRSLPLTPMAFSVPTLTRIYQVSIAIILLLIVVFLVVFGKEMVREIQEEIARENETSTVLSLSDVTRIQSVEDLFIEAEDYWYESQETLFGVCEAITLPALVECQSTDVDVAFEIPVENGFYCSDSTGYGEITEESVIGSGLCGGVVAEEPAF